MKEKRQDFLIYGKEYELFRNGEYVGVGVWTDDDNVGEVFIQVQPDGAKLVFGEIDEWTFR